jgi:hypothetical protein
MRPRRAVVLLLLVGSLPAAGVCKASRSEFRGGFGAGDMRFLRETSFARQAGGSVVSALTLTLVPVGDRTA